MSAPPPASRRLSSQLTTPLVAVFLAVVAWATTPATYSVADAAAMAALYALLAIALVQGTRALAAWGLVGRLAGAIVAGLVLAWHWREQTRIEGSGATLWTVDGLLAFLPLVAVISGFFLLFELARGRDAATRQRFPRNVLGWALATVLFFGLLFGVFDGTPTARWHLIRHNKMIGTTAFHLFGTPVADIEAEQWAAHRRGAPVGQPRWVLDLYQTASAAAPGAEAGLPSPEVPFAAVPTSATPPRPDIVVIMLDTLRADGLAAYGGDAALMPAINDLAGEATLFTDVVANAPWTQPSVASLFTGVLPEEHGVISYPFRMSGNVVTLAEVLGAQGYDTAAFIANGVLVNPDSGFARGFDTFRYIGDPQLTYARADTVSEVVSEWLTGTPSDDLQTPRSTAPDRAPLFLYVHYFDPHVPYLSSSLSDAQQASLSFDEARRYYGDELRFLDGEVARLTGVVADTLKRPRALLITSDHGEEFGEHGGLGHSQTLYSEVLDIPALLQLHDVTNAAAPASIDARLEGRDFFDLLLRLGSGEPLDVAGWAGGRDRATRIASLYFEKDPGRSELVHYLLRPYRSRIYNRMIQRDGKRYIYSAFGPTDELYDLLADAAERVNLATAEPGRVDDLRAELDQLPPYWAQLIPLELSQEALQNLRQLGYIR